jgi:hypothetical protein
MAAWPKGAHHHIVKSGKVGGNPTLALPRLWLAIYPHHPTWSPPMAAVARRVSVWPRGVHACLR